MQFSSRHSPALDKQLARFSRIPQKLISNHIFKRQETKTLILQEA
jgi:hypothetical protein